VLAQGWARLIELLEGRPDTDPMTRVKHLCELCVSVTGVTGAALAVASQEHRSTVFATDAVGGRLEDLQLTLAQGPTLDALRIGRPVLVPDLADPAVSPWQRFAPAAVESGAQAMFVLPVPVGATALGVLELYRARAGGLSAEQSHDAQTLAGAAAVLLTEGNVTDTPETFSWAVDERSGFQREVHQAVGTTMSQLGVTAREAFALICAHAFATSRPIREVADDILADRLRLKAK
jgi:transcriptional regulator with GAF, ATPase, and Fis domain